MASKKKGSASVDERRFGVAVSTGFRSAEPVTRRTVELFLCPEKGWHGPDQSHGFVAEVKNDRVRCSYCDQPHPIVEFFDAETRGLIVAKYTEEKTWKG
jgi:hypothetical protein